MLNELEKRFITTTVYSPNENVSWPKRLKKRRPECLNFSEHTFTMFTSLFDLDVMYVLWCLF